MDVRMTFTLIAALFLILSGGSGLWTLAWSILRPDDLQRHPHLTRLVAILCIAVSVGAAFLLALYWRGGF